MTDSGDNVGSGADGFNNYVLRQIMNLDDFNHKILVSGIVDFNAHAFLMNKEGWRQCRI
ncbi:MAG: MlrC C-terminal domain-containing protein [Holdemanella porci]